MQANHHLLLAIDDSDASRRAVAYVGGVVGDAPRFRIRLLHVLPPIPTGLLEHGGCDSGEACPAEREVVDGRARWQEECERAAAPLIEATRESLCAAGVSPERVDAHFAAPLPEETIGYHVLKSAHDLGCDTVAVGRTPRSWFRNALHRSPASTLLGGKSHGIAIWIVT